MHSVKPLETIINSSVVDKKHEIGISVGAWGWSPGGSWEWRGTSKTDCELANITPEKQIEKMRNALIKKCFIVLLLFVAYETSNNTLFLFLIRPSIPKIALTFES